MRKALEKPELVARAAHHLKAMGLRSTVELIRGKMAQLLPTGYSATGVIVEVGSRVSELSVSDRVACAGDQFAHHAEVISVPSNLVVRVPEQVPLEEAAFTTLGAVAMHGVRRVGASFGEVVVVIGLGLVGQLACQLLKAAGCRVVAVDLNPYRVSLAENLGADKGILLGSEDPVPQVELLTNGLMADAALLAAASKGSEPVNLAAKLVRDRGRITILGYMGTGVDVVTFIRKELEIASSRAYGPGRYDEEYEDRGLDYPVGYVRWTERRNMAEFLRLLAVGKVRVAPLIIHQFPIEEASQAYATLSDPQVQSLGILLKYPESEVPPPLARRQVVESKPRKASDGILRVALIGCGDHARSVLLPLLRRLPAYHLRALVSESGANAKVMSRQYGAEICATDPQEVLADPEVDLVIISTKHHQHAPLAVEAARAGKHIFLEKPMGMAPEECRAVAEAVRQAGVYFCLGFNRRLAPLAVRAKEILARLEEPVMVQYRVNAGRLSPGHWFNDPVQGGGRLIGEACHFSDFICWLVGSGPVEVWTKRTPTFEARRGEVDNDNVVGVLCFQNGSIGCLMYTSLGHSSMEKERIEVFAGGTAMVLENFEELRVAGAQSQRFRLRRPDKGHRGLLEAFARSLREGTPSPVGAEEALESSLVTFQMLEALSRPTRFGA